MAKVDVGEDFYKLLHPKLTTLVVSRSEDGKVNVMACSWIMPVSEDPPKIALSIWRESYTYELISKVGEFTVNIPLTTHLKEVWLAGSKSGREFDKVSAIKMTFKPAKLVKPPIIEECAGHLECKVCDKVDAGECAVFIADVLAAYADEQHFKKVWDVYKANVLMHLGGRAFTTLAKHVLRA